MTELSEIQFWLARLLRRRGSLPKNREISEHAAAHVTGNTWLSPAEQIEVYREQFWLRHTGSLVEDFPGLGGVLGQADWEKLVEGYLEKYEPDSYTLRDLGNRLPEYIATEALWLPHHRLCLDMARLEWAYALVFDAQETAPLDAGRLAAIPDSAWETARILLNPALQLLQVDYPVADLRRKLKAAALSSETVSSETLPIPERKPQNLVVYRGSNRNLFYRDVTDGAFAVLDELGKGTPLVAACERALERTGANAEELQAVVGSWFTDWAQRGWVVGVETQ